MTEQEYIGLVNITGGILSIHLMILFAIWVWRDWRSLWGIAAGLLVFVVFFGLILRGYESLYYGAARFLHSEGVNLWQEDPWTGLIAVVRSTGLLLLMGGYAAKVRADGHPWRKVLTRTAGFALEGVVIAVGVYLLFIA